MASHTITIGRRVHGPDHKNTARNGMLLFVCLIPNLPGFTYESEGEICVVTCPITKPQNKNNERTYRVESHLIHPVVGCPVIFLWWYQWIAKKIDQVCILDYFDRTKIDGDINIQS